MEEIPYTTQIMLSAEEPVKFKLNMEWSQLNYFLSVRTFE